MKRQAVLTRSVGTKVSEHELSMLGNCARASAMNLSAWVRRTLLAAAEEGRVCVDEIALGEVLALRTIVINLLFSIAQGQPVTTESMKALIDRSDADKARRATERLAASTESIAGSQSSEI
jgi:hypothetical protein